MIVMKEHDWFDDCINYVEKKHTTLQITVVDRKKEISINKHDVIALAKELNLIVFEKDSQL